MKTIEIKCSGVTNVSIDNLTPFQGDLKDLTQENYLKLRKQILELGFSEPIAVWSSDRLYILNGHQRVRTLKQMREEGYTIPLIPVIDVEAKDIKEAKKKVLALTSQYGTITSEGLFEFMSEAGLNLDEIEKSFRFPEIDFNKFQDENLKDHTDKKPPKTFICPHCKQEI